MSNGTLFRIFSSILFRTSMVFCRKDMTLQSKLQEKRQDSNNLPHLPKQNLAQTTLYPYAFGNG